MEILQSCIKPSICIHHWRICYESAPTKPTDRNSISLKYINLHEFTNRSIKINHKLMHISKMGSIEKLEVSVSGSFIFVKPRGTHVSTHTSMPRFVNAVFISRHCMKDRSVTAWRLWNFHSRLIIKASILRWDMRSPSASHISGLSFTAGVLWQPNDTGVHHRAVDDEAGGMI